MNKAYIKTALVMLLAICLCTAFFSLNAFADDIVYYVNEDIGNVLLAHTEAPVKDCVCTWGALSEGLHITWSGSDIYMYGTPTEEGDFYAEFDVITTDGREWSFEFTFGVEAAKEKPVTKPVSKELTITKHPTGETVETGGSAKFISRADNATKFTWRLVSPDTTNTVQCAYAANEFPGLKVSGADTDTLILENIPASLNKWCVECKFENADGFLCSNGARITVIGAEPTRNESETKKPVESTESKDESEDSASPETPAVTETNTGKPANIVSQPKSIRVEDEETVVLSVTATSPNNGSLSYQWYSGPTDNRDAALPIGGASDEVYSFVQSEGTAYYWVAVWNTKDGKQSEPVFSTAAEVHVGAEPTPAPTQTPTPESLTETPQHRGNFQLILFGIIGFLALAALVTVVIYLKLEEKQERENRDR